MDRVLPCKEKRATARLSIVEIFKITCVTCQAGLSVRNESIIGEIVACPQCGSMVEVVPPGEAADLPTELITPEAIESSTPVPVAQELTAAEPLITETVGSFRWIFWGVGILVVGATILGTALFWPADAEVSDAASPHDNSQSEATEVQAPAITEPSANVDPLVTPKETTTTETLEPVEIPVEEPVVAEREEPLAEAQIGEAIPQAVEVEVARVARRYDPLDLDPEGLDLAALDNLTEASPVTEPSGTPEAEKIDKEPTTSTLPVVRRGSDPRWDVAASDAKQRLARRLPTIEFNRMRLVDFLSLISQLSGSPVSVSSEQLLMAGISGRKLVSLDAEGITLDESLTQVLQPLRLKHMIDGPQVIVVRQEADQVRDIEYPIDDLISDDTSAEKLSDWIRQLVAPANWDEANLEIASGTLRIKQSRTVHYRVLVFLERLRLVRGMSTRSRYPIERLAPTPLHAAMAERLTAPALFTFSRETPIGEVFLHWQRELDLPLLVDWPALSEVQLWPDSTVVCAVADQPWHEVLTEVLEPLGLDWRAAAGGAIEISTIEQLGSDSQLELYRLSSEQPVNGEQVVNGLRKHLATLRHSDSPEANTELLLDPTGPALLALQSASAQRDILAWLVEQNLIPQKQ